MNSIFFTLLSFIFTLNIYAQNHCNFVLDEAGKQRLIRNKNTLSTQSTNVRYVPLKLFIVGNDNGTINYRLSAFFASICQLNQDFKTTGIYYYIHNDIEYIFNTALNEATDPDLFDTFLNLKDETALNVFVVSVASGACGYYVPGFDYVVLAKSCNTENDHTFAHEMGHLFSLPHTFNGWEGGFTPPIQDIELLNGTNCATAGDFFCDTKADYVSNRWACPYNSLLTDPNNQTFKPDSSMFMSYALDECMSRFSVEQSQAMNADLSFRTLNLPATLDTTLPQIPQILAPNDSISAPANFFSFSWNRIDDAFAYHVQITRTSNFASSIIDVMTTDTSFFTSKLNKDRYHRYRVKALKRGNVCGSFSEPRVVYATNPTSINSIEWKNEISIFPNPTSGNINFSKNPVTIGYTQFILFNTIGNVVQSGNLNANSLQINFKAPSGIYFLRLSSGISKNSDKIFKIILQR
jgi:hypothetical protein